MITRYQLMNTLLKENRKKYDPNEVWTEYYNLKYIKDLIYGFKHIEIVDKSYCCYGDFRCCWCDVEGEGYGWLWVDKPEETWHNILVEWLESRFKTFNKELKGKKIIHIWDEKTQTRQIILPMRDTCHYDVYITLSDNEIDCF